jgi:hypothetical protein
VVSRFGLVVIAFAACSRAESAPSPPPSDAAPPPEPLKDKCRNPPRLEMGGLGLGGGSTGVSECMTRHTPTPLPAGVSLAIAPNPVIVRPGQDGSANLVIENGSAADVELYLDDKHDALTRPTYEIDDAAGKRVDVDGQECAVLAAMIPQTIHIGLSAHRFTTVPFDVHAIVSRYTGLCEPTGTVPLRAGRYVLVVHTPLGDVRGRLAVR